MLTGLILPAVLLATLLLTTLLLAGLILSALLLLSGVYSFDLHRMISEKISEARAGLTLMTGGSSAKVIAQYRKRVSANSKRLSRAKR